MASREYKMSLDIEYLHKTIRELLELERPSCYDPKNKPSEAEVRRYNELFSSLPQVFSLDDLMQYHLFAVSDIENREEEREEDKEKTASVEDSIRFRMGVVKEYIDDLRTQTLGALKVVCSPTAYEKLELALNHLYAEAAKRIENELSQAVANKE